MQGSEILRTFQEVPRRKFRMLQALPIGAYQNGELYKVAIGTRRSRRKDGWDAQRMKWKLQRK